MKKSVRIVVIVLLPLVLLATPSCTTVNPATHRASYNLYSIQNDIQLGDTAMKANVRELERQGVPINTDRARLVQIQGIVRRIAAVSDMPNLPYSVTLAETNIVNAAALPGGPVLVFSGLYDPQIGLVRDQDEMAAVLAHEIAHVNARHSTERLSAMETAQTVGDLAASVAGRTMGQTSSQILQALFSVGTSLWIPKYSRADELEADHIGLLYMAKAGFDPRAAEHIWERAIQQQKEKGGPEPADSIFSTHPTDETRLKALQELMPQAITLYRQATGKYPPGCAASAPPPPAW